MTPASLVLMRLGAFRFGIGGPSHETVRRAATYRWSTQDRHGRDPASQFAGPGAETIQLEGTILPAIHGGLHQVEAMRLVARQGQPLMLVDGMGWIFMRWTILRIEETRTLFMPDGAARQIEFQLELQSYGRDRPWQIM